MPTVRVRAQGLDKRGLKQDLISRLSVAMQSDKTFMEPLRKAEQDRYKRAMMAQVQRERQEAESPGADAAESLDVRYLRGELATADVSQDGQAVLLSAVSSLAELRGVTRDRLKELGLPMRDRRPVIMLQKRLEKDADGGGDSV